MGTGIPGELMTIKTTSINVDEETHKKFKVCCIKKNLSMGVVVSNFMQEYINDDNGSQIPVAKLSGDE